MTLDKVSAREIAVSGISAQRLRMNVIANNIANANTTRTPEGGAFRRQMAILRGGQIASASNHERPGVEVKRVVRDPSELRQVYEPDHPDADEGGYVNYPNVNISAEMVDMVSAQRAYEANLAVLMSGIDMGNRALQIIEV
ncbi:MAG: flagellar basal body rod protein FlgC [Candidatus Hydrogenedentota bacterium]